MDSRGKEDMMAWIWSQGWIQGGGVLPSVRQMAQARGVSVRPILQALHQFATQGMLVVRHGGRVEVIIPNQEAQAAVQPEPPAEIAIAERLRAGIAQGRFRAGEALPKATWLCMDWNISTRVLAGACRRLAKEDLLHKQGKKWVVGNDTAKHPLLSAASRDAILIVCNRPDEWAEFHTNLLDDFARTIEMEANRLGVRLIPALTGVLDVPRVFPLGRAEIRRTVQELGDNLRGILLTPLLADLPEFDEWCTWLARFGVPIVWMQDYEPTRPLPEVAEKLYRITYGAWVSPDMLTEADLAMQALHAKGHREVVFASNEPKITYWFHLRADELLMRAKPLGMTVHVIEREVDEKALMRLVLDVPKATALLAPNDRFAVRYWQALAEQGIRIPRDLSMVSFDNLADLHPFPITSVDFGMASLGYKAFHLLLGDVPIQVQKGDHVMGISQLVDNGSIARPRSHKRIQLSP